MEIYDQYIDGNKCRLSDPSILKNIPGKLEVQKNNNVRHFFKELDKAIRVSYFSDTNIIRLKEYFWQRSHNDYILHRQDGPAIIKYSPVYYQKYIDNKLDGSVYLIDLYYLNGKQITKEKHAIFRINDIINGYGREIIYIDNKYAIVDKRGSVKYVVDTFEDLENECLDIVETMEKLW